MCNPVAAMVVMAAISITATTMQQRAQTKKINEEAGFMKENARQQELAAEEAKRLDNQALDQRKVETQTKTTLDIIARQKQQAREEAMLRVSSAEAGILGNTVDRQLISSVLGANYDIGIIQENQENTEAQLALEGANVDALFQSRVNQAGSMSKQADLKLKSKPSGGLAFLQIGGAGASGAAEGYNMGNGMDGAFTTEPRQTGLGNADMTAMNSSLKNKRGGSI